MHGWRAVSGVYGERQRYVRCQEGVRDRGEDDVVCVHIHVYITCMYYERAYAYRYAKLTCVCTHTYTCILSHILKNM